MQPPAPLRAGPARLAARLHHGDVSGLLEILAREREQAKPQKRVESKPGPKPKDPAAKSKRITPWQQKELDGVEERIAELEGEIEVLDGRLADPALYSGPRSDVETIQAERVGLEQELAERYSRWEELESLRSPSA